MKKVLEIVPYSYLPYFSGGQKSIGQFLDYFSKEVDLTVIGTVNNDWSLAKNYKGISLLKAPFSRYYDLSLVGKITSLVKENNYDTIIWEHPYYWWLAKKIRKRTGIKTIFHTHNIEHQRFRSNNRWWWPILKIYEKKCFQGADTVFFISDDDRNFVLDNWKIDPGKCFTIPFGVDIKNYPENKAESKRKIAANHGIPDKEKIFLFNGLLNYKPNLDAVTSIIHDINPPLLNTTLQYKIIICGKGLPPELNELKDYADKNIIYAGFVDDIEMYFKGADLFLNPILTGGGIKTKMVEAIAFGTTVISTKSGAMGIDRSVCGEKLVEINDNDWKTFAEAITKYSQTNSITPPAYYVHYYWGNIVKKAEKTLS